MNKPNKSINSGVHGSTGIEFQKHCALYLLFEKYRDLENRKYFVCLEHHDDFLFCYQTGDELISSIEAYQAKKASTPWSMGEELYALIRKMVEVGTALYEDDMPKIDGYIHSLDFITNNTITLNNGKKKRYESKTVTINESNSKVKFIDLDKEISGRIETEVEKQLNNDSSSLKEFRNISMCYIDLPKKSKHQKDCLVGMFNDIFGDKVNDPKAAVETLLLLFRDVETTLNQGNIAKLMDKSKRIESSSINETINIVTTKKMAFKLWRDEKKEICNKLGITILDRPNFELNFDNSFDRFKDLQQAEHIKILSFVRENRHIIDNFTDESDCIKEIYRKFQNNINSQLPELSIKAAIYAAYIEVRETA